MKLPLSGRRNRNITFCASGSDKFIAHCGKDLKRQGDYGKKKNIAFQWHSYCILSISCIKILALIYGCSKLTLWSSSFIAYWFRDAPTGWTFNNRMFCPHCIFVFCIYLRTNRDLYCLHHKLIAFDNQDKRCLLRGTAWAFKWKQSAIRL